MRALTAEQAGPSLSLGASKASDKYAGASNFDS